VRDAIDTSPVRAVKAHALSGGFAISSERYADAISACPSCSQVLFAESTSPFDNRLDNMTTKAAILGRPCFTLNRWFKKVVRKGGFEPPRSCERQPLKLQAVNGDQGRPRKIEVGFPSSLLIEAG